MLQKPKTIALDWLSLSLLGHIELISEKGYENVINDNLVLIGCGYTTPMFEQTFKVFVGGVEFATLLSTPRRPELMNELTVHLEVKNERLYEAENTDTINQILTDLKLKFKHIVRVDVAVDGLGLLNPIIQCDKGKYQRVGKGDLTLRKFANGKLKMAYIGSRNSGKMFAGYNKGKDIERTGKQYIKGYWKNAGATDKECENMERIEIRFRRSEIKKYSELEGEKALANVFDLEFMKQLFITGCSKMYEFVKDQKKRTNEQARVFVLTLSKIKVVALEKLKSIATNTIYATKVAIKKMYEIGNVYYNAKRYKHFAKELASNWSLSAWYDEKQKFWDKMIKQKIEAKDKGYINQFRSIINV